jgi:hypothetical protein
MTDHTLREHTIHVAIGNTDNGLSQQEWSEFYEEVERAIRSIEAFRVGEVYGRWASLPTAPWQNACWAFSVDDPGTRTDLRLALALAAKRYRQESIAWNESVTEFITPPVQQAEVSRARLDQINRGDHP